MDNNNLAANNDNTSLKIANLRIYGDYSNQQISEAFGCSRQGGMRRSNATNTLVIISNHTSKSIYGDNWINGKLYYTDKGQEGDQSLTFAQNKTLN